ncbi:thiamine-phosphate kinase [Rubrobacter indicoceani]|uniref:thiamine-phosphate kinase n=1 Tax=Rubrobacter indicoceani TaxID=2051957 RepID=UPI0013C42335|nr:thiamine-phosphate kinase [Rubrobacter indicoceani]
MREFEVIDRIRALLPSAPEGVILPIGDDCAVIEVGGERWVAAADMLVAGRHFREEWSSPGDVGFKAVAVNVSDVAAMGARPRFVLTSGGAPGSEVALGCFAGVAEACREFGVYPIGGDTTGSERLVVDVAILGSLEGRDFVARSGAGAGDVIAVSGELGAAAAGLLALERGVEGYERLKARHRRPEPRVEAGVAAAEVGMGAMIDLSDGLASDVRHVCERSGVGCRIDLGLLPVSPDVRELALKLGEDPERLAATGGEDFELLFCGPEAAVEKLGRVVGTPVTVIGEVLSEAKGVGFLKEGRAVPDLSGWDHFS